MREMSAASYRMPGVQVVANSRTLQRKITGTRRSGDRGDRAGVRGPERSSIRSRSPPEKRLPRILVVGPDSTGTALEPLTFKGIGDIRDALTLLRAAGEQFEIVRISNTPPEIFRDVECEFHQAPADDEKTRLFGTADILVYASHYDSCPRPPLEGMAAGLAVVCTATEGATEYCVHGENALLVPPARPDELAAAVRTLLHDGEHSRHACGAAAARPRTDGRRIVNGQTMLSVIARALPAQRGHPHAGPSRTACEGVDTVCGPSA